MQPVAIVGDAAMYHVECARHVYGSLAIDRTLSGDTDMDGEGNGLGVVLDFDWGDLHGEDGTPESCGHCLGYLVEYEEPAYSPLARDILNLTVDAKDDMATRMASWCASVARQWDTQPDILLSILRERPVFSSDVTGMDLLREAIKLAESWVETWNAREVITLHIIVNEYGNTAYGDANGVEWGVYDMRGYLDNLGDYCCESCGCKLDSHAYYPVDDNTYYCPDCVVVD
jgi:hypothetical protein